MVLPIYKGKGDPMECGSYREIKLLEHATKVVERISEYRIRQQIEINDTQFRFMKLWKTTEVIFIVKQMQKNFRAKGKKVYNQKHLQPLIRFKFRNLCQKSTPI